MVESVNKSPTKQTKDERTPPSVFKIDRLLLFDASGIQWKDMNDGVFVLEMSTSNLQVGF